MTCAVCNAFVGSRGCKSCRQEVPPGADPRWRAWAGMVAACIHAGTHPQILGWSHNKLLNAQDWLEIEGYAGQDGKLTEAGAMLALEGRA